MPRTSKNSFEVINNEIHISREGWGEIALTTYRDDYYEELINYTWTKDNHGYLTNGKLGYLHRYIMGKWYDEEVLKKMTDDGWVVDHINNNSMDCRISNLEFLLKRHNTAKGLKLDIDREEHINHLTLNIQKDFDTGNYQLSLICNDPIVLVYPNGEIKQPIVIRLLYNCNYKIVFSDAEKILDLYDEYKRVNLAQLSHVAIKVEETEQIKLTDQEKEEIENKGRVFVERNGKFYAILGPNLQLVETDYIHGWDLSSDKQSNNF